MVLSLSSAILSCVTDQPAVDGVSLDLVESDWLLIHEWHQGPYDEVRELWRAGPRHIVLDAEGGFVSTPIEGKGTLNNAGKIPQARAQNLLCRIAGLLDRDEGFPASGDLGNPDARYIMISMNGSSRARTIVFPVYMQATSDHIRELYLCVQEIRREVANSILGGTGF